jgi:hypothetical protein
MLRILTRVPARLARTDQARLVCQHDGLHPVPEIGVLALAGLIIAATGGMLPATWAARSRTVTALRAE